MTPKRLAALGGLAVGLGALSLTPTLAGAEPHLRAPSDTSTSAASPWDRSATAASAAEAARHAAFAAFASGGQETPPNDSTAWAWMELNPSADGSSLEYTARVFLLDNPTMAHLHLGTDGVAGPIVVPLKTPGAPRSSGCVDAATFTITELSANAPTSDRERCVARGASPSTTFLPAPAAPSPSTSAPSSGSSSSSPSVSAPSGTTPSTNATAAASNPTTSVAASHSPACAALLRVAAATGLSPAAGQAASAAPSSSGICGFADVSGTIKASDLTGPLAGKTVPDLLAAVQKGDIYVNFHSSAIPAGEIRGQVTVWGSGAASPAQSFASPTNSSPTNSSPTSSSTSTAPSSSSSAAPESTTSTTQATTEPTPSTAAPSSSSTSEAPAASGA